MAFTRYHFGRPCLTATYHICTCPSARYKQSKLVRGSIAASKSYHQPQEWFFGTYGIYYLGRFAMYLLQDLFKISNQLILDR